MIPTHSETTGILAQIVEVGELSPRQFLRLMFGLYDLPEEEAKEYELDRDYQSEGRKILARVTGNTTWAVYSWGAYPEFLKMPQYYRRHLWLYWQLHELLQKRQQPTS